MQQRVELIIAVEEDVHKLERNLKSIHGVLVEAERRQLESPPIKQWLDNLKEVSYTIDDVLDEWSTLILKSQMEKDDFNHNNGCSFRDQLLHIPIMIKQVFSFIPISCFEFARRDKIAEQIKLLNGRLDEIAKERERYNFDSTKANGEVKRMVVSSAIDVAEVKGREKDKIALIEMLMGEKSKLEIVSIVGTGGLGKTTLAKLVYNDSEVEKHFESRIWVSVSKPFDEIKIAKAILEILTDAASFLVEYEAIMHHIEKLLEGKRFLLVLDDVWEDCPVKWERMRYSFKSSSLGSCVLVTTRDGNVAGKMGCTRNHLFPLGKLYFEDCWSIFSEIAFFDKDEDVRGRLDVIGRQIVKKCDGLALAAKTLGCNLRSKNSWEEWENVLNSEVWELEEIWSKNGETRTGFSSLWFSYYDLVSELRPCFSYCAILPKNYEIKKDDLIQLWMAQGYLRQTTLEDMERIGDKFFQNLVAHSFFEDLEKNSSGNVICKMYNMMHDFAQYIRKDECLSLEINDGEDFGVKVLDKEVRHLRLMLGNEVSFPKSFLMLKNLRSLWIQSSGNLKIEMMLPKLFGGLTCLRYLNLSNCDIAEIPSSISKLIHLRQIDLSCNKELKELPEALCELYNLQTLNISWCIGLLNLPKGTARLINLRHLHNGGFEGVLPKGISRLTSLRSLYRFNIGKESNEHCSLKDMKNLSHLQGFLCIKGLENVADSDEAKLAELKRKTGVTTLELRFGKGEEAKPQNLDAELLNALEPPPYLEEMRIYEYKGRTIFPSWMICLTNLKTVLLTNCKNCEELPPLGKLPYLEYLRIWGMDGVKEVSEEFFGLGGSDGIAFPRLIRLRFVRMRSWERWVDHEFVRNKKRIIMPQLRCLSFAWCTKLKEVPEQFLRKETLKELIITCSPLLIRNYKKETGKDWPIISHIPKIKFWDFGEKRFITLLEERGLIRRG
ncbi:putative disease resistance protein RGA3 [Euphorbia lathyris]|uniref:putative disease resistance protein RGA3 n=1 Tax=Euphorbia lathyris TaxID=212925 RepID=UPI00331435CF